MYFEKGPVTPTDLAALVPSRRRRWWIAGVGLIVAGVAGFVLFRYVTNPEPLLTAARKLLISKTGASGSSVPLRSVHQAEELLQSYLSRSGDAADSANLLLLDCVWHTGQSEGAGLALDRIDLSKCRNSELSEAALAAFRANDFRSAERLIAVALDRPESDRERVLRAAAVIRFDTGRRQDVLAHCRELAVLAPNDPNPWIVITSIYEGRDDWSSVVENYRQVIARTAGEKLQERSIMIGFLLQSGNIAEARQELDALQKDAPQVVQEQLVLEAKVLYQEGHSKQALPFLNRVLRSSPNERDALYLKGRIQFEDGDLANAAKLLERVVELDPLDDQSRYLLSQAYHRLGRKSDGEKMLAAYRGLELFKQQLYSLESAANSNPLDLYSRQELVKICEHFGANEKAEYWRRSLGQQATGATESQP
ncbi:MAG: tetratricopeptide repeat protein [Planctomycetaceae bacterium]|nr:tetratricopeptide repeat protein [Planctomycetaceae bacterium]